MQLRWLRLHVRVEESGRTSPTPLLDAGALQLHYYGIRHLCHRTQGVSTVLLR